MIGLLWCFKAKVFGHKWSSIENVNEATNIENIKERNRQKKVKNTGSSPHVLTMNMCAYI